MENSFLDNSWNKKEIKSETGECLRNADNKTLRSRNCGVGLKHAERKFCICVNNKELSTWFKKLENELQRKPKNRVKQTHTNIKPINQSKNYGLNEMYHSLILWRTK